MPIHSRRTKRSTKRSPKTPTPRRKTAMRHRQADVCNMGGPEAGVSPPGASPPSGLSGYGFRSAMAEMFQGRNQVSPYGLRSAAVAAPVAAAAAADIPAAAATGSEAVAQQRPVRVAMQRILRELK